MAHGAELLVGRDQELERLEVLLGSACSGRAEAVFLSGEPGIGKTHVLAELVRRAERRGCLVLEGRAAEFEQELPFGVVIDALDAYVESLGRTVVDRLAADGLGELADIFPSLRGLRAVGERPAGAAERFRSYYAVRELLERLAGTQPLVLVLDDLHWADGASLELVAHLLRRPPDAPLLLAGSYRPRQLGRALLAAIDAGNRAGKVECLELGPLAPGDAGRLVPAVDTATRDRLYVQSGGNPFYLLQLARIDGAGDGATAPPAVAAAIAQELAALSGPARDMAEAAAVVGDPFDLDVTAAAAGVPEAAALTAIDELIARDLVRPSQVPRRFHFRHPLVRSAVYQGASMSTRLAGHARCAEALAARGAPAVARAHHLEQSAAHGDVGAAGILVDAAEASARHLPSSAARWYGAALRILPATTPRDERVTLLLAAATALTTAGRLHEARTTLLEGLDLAGAGEARVRLIAACAGVEQQLGQQQEAHGRLLAALDELTDRRSEAGVALMVALATDAFYRNEFGDIVRWGLDAVAAASALGSRTLTAASEAVLTLGYSFTGDTEQAEAHRLVAAGLIDAMTDDELAVRSDALGHLAGAELYLERFEETAAHARRGIALARAAGQGDFFPTLFPCLGSAAWVLGRLAESAEVLDAAVDLARLSGNAQGVAWGLLNRSLGALWAGDWTTALEAGKEGTDLAATLGNNFVASLAGVIYGWALVDTGDPVRGAAQMVAGGGGDDLSLVPGGWRATYLEVLTRAWLAQGRIDDARRAAAWAREVADAVGLPRTDALAHRAAASVALHAGDAVLAVEEARASVAAAEKVSARVDAAMSRILLGRALIEAGETGAAALELEKAAADFDAYGSPRHRDMAEQHLRKLGHHVSRRSAPGKARGEGMAALSERELEVGRLVVKRRTNPEIAADLFLSLKTVETHMRNIFRKLGVTSRVEVAQVLERAAPA